MNRAVAELIMLILERTPASAINRLLGYAFFSFLGIFALVVGIIIHLIWPYFFGTLFVLLISGFILFRLFIALLPTFIKLVGLILVWVKRKYSECKSWLRELDFFKQMTMRFNDEEDKVLTKVNTSGDWREHRREFREGKRR